MQSGQPSRTALGAAFHRATHQVLDGGAIFHDPLALRILGVDEAAVRQFAEARPDSRRISVFIACRHRFAEEVLAASGVRQVVILGAGLDTSAYRNTDRSRRYFEVDHPATQAWKRVRLATAGIEIPKSLTFAPVDFERETLADGLSAAGFDRNAPAFFTWLGVLPYLTSEAIWSTLGFIASVPGSQVVFDYANPPGSLSGEAREAHDRLAARVAELGEAVQSYFDSDVLHGSLREFGFGEIEDLGPRQIAGRWFPHLASGMPEYGGHIVRASTSAAA